MRSPVLFVLSVLLLGTLALITVAPANAATVVEDFDYVVGDLHGQNGGSGFSAPWSAPGLDFATTGTAVEITGFAFYATATRTLAPNPLLPLDGDSAYASLKVTVLSGAPQLELAVRHTGQGSNWSFGVQNNQFFLNGGGWTGTLTPGVEYLIVSRVTRTDGGNDPVVVWVDPISELDAPVFEVSTEGYLPDALTEFHRVELFANSESGDGLRIGEVRLGASYAEVLDLPEAPMIQSITDVPNDQGRQVRIVWSGSEDHSSSSAPPVTSYSLYRRYDPSLKRVYPPGEWDFVKSVPAFQEAEYSTVVPTLADSTVVGGIYESVFFVRAGTAVTGTYFDSQPDSGFSVDNLAPGVPKNITANYQPDQVNLSWDDAPEADFQYHRIYRDTDPQFTPTPSNLVAETASSGWIDPTQSPYGYSYKITTVDHSGNEGPAGEPLTVTSAPNTPAPARFALHAAVPNPFNPRTTLSFSLPTSSELRLAVYDVSGRLVTTLVQGEFDAGRHEVIWEGIDDQGRSVASGVYLYRVEASGFAETRRMVLLK